MQKQKISSRDAVECMIEFVRSNLQLENQQGPNNNKTEQSVLFTGKGNDGTDFVLEVITQTERAARKDIFERRVKERSKPRLKQDRTYTGIIFPRSIDYKTAISELKTPYLRQANLLETANEELRNMYGLFERNNIKMLSRVEWEFALPLGGSKITYFNAQEYSLQICRLQSLPFDEVIPDNIPLEKAYFWGYAKNRRFPDKNDWTLPANTFRNIEEGLHHKIRKMIGTEKIIGDFTLGAYKTGGASIIKL